MKSKIGLTVLTIMFVLLTSSIIVLAQTYQNKTVYGDRYTVVADGTNDDNCVGYVTVCVTEIYKSDGTDSNYSKVRSDIVGWSGEQLSTSTDIVLKKGESTNIPLIFTYASGTRMRLRMKGNISSLDCIVNFNAAITSQ